MLVILYPVFTFSNASHFVPIVSFCTQFVLFLLCLFVILVISHFGFEGGIWVLIAPVPGHCLLVTFSHSYQDHFVPGYEVTLVRIYLIFRFVKARDQRSWV